MTAFERNDRAICEMWKLSPSNEARVEILLYFNGKISFC